MAVENTSGFERHLQTAISAIAVAVLAWVGLTLTTVQQAVTRLEEQMNNSAARVGANDQRIGRLENGQVDLRIRVDRLEQKK